MALHPLVALTRAVLEGFHIQDLDFPAGVLDQTGRLQSVRRQSYSFAGPRAFPLNMLV
jgi:hypothetical protein